MAFRRDGPDLRTRAYVLLVAAAGCLAYIFMSYGSGESTRLAWLPLLLCAAGALHYFRVSRR